MYRVIDAHIDIDAPPERVWDELVDFSAWGEWNSFIPSVTGTLEVGAAMRITVSPPGIRSMTFEPRVFSLEPGKEIVWGGSFLFVAYRGDHAFFLAPLPGGGTRFRQRERFRGPMVLFMGGMIEATERGYHQMNEAFKRRVEGVGQRLEPPRRLAVGSDVVR